MLRFTTSHRTGVTLRASDRVDTLPLPAVGARPTDGERHDPFPDDQVSTLERCRANERCGQAENVPAENEDEQPQRLGGVIDRPGLCETCLMRVNEALISLPVDVRDLSPLLIPTARQRLRDPDMPPPPHIMTAPPLPLRTNVLALQELIDYEVTVWAEAVADSIEHEWTPPRTAGMRNARVAHACTLLRDQLPALVGLGPQEQRARSLTARRGDHHDPDTTTRDRHDYWCLRDGPIGALLLLDLHRRAERFCGRHPDGWLRTPCPRCHNATLERWHHTNQVYCRWCRRPMSDNDFDDFLEMAFQAYGIRVDEPKVVVDSAGREILG